MALGIGYHCTWKEKGREYHKTRNQKKEGLTCKGGNGGGDVEVRLRQGEEDVIFVLGHIQVEDEYTRYVRGRGTKNHTCHGWGWVLGSMDADREPHTHPHLVVLPCLVLKIQKFK
ncbi:hypothetical protein HKD37_16G044936 [Glycine soja]